MRILKSSIVLYWTRYTANFTLICIDHRFFAGMLRFSTSIPCYDWPDLQTPTLLLLGPLFYVIDPSNHRTKVVDEIFYILGWFFSLTSWFLNQTNNGDIYHERVKWKYVLPILYMCYEILKTCKHLHLVNGPYIRWGEIEFIVPTEDQKLTSKYICIEKWLRR